jgi:hypothetical protein
LNLKNEDIDVRCIKKLPETPQAKQQKETPVSNGKKGIEETQKAATA